MRKWWMVAVTMLLFVACRNNDKQQPVEDSAPAEMPPVTIVDTEPTEPTVTTSPELFGRGTDDGTDDGQLEIEF
ncbi:MAG: hypothetical protein IJQ14_04285 [Bacteroidales bacterium]|jgi:uncharacterized protein YcfL|nr:hypothetical protein [Bacteroidales bacterium]